MDSLLRFKGLFYHLSIMIFLCTGALLFGGIQSLISAAVSSFLVGLNFLFFPIIWNLLMIRHFKFLSLIFFFIKYAILAAGLFLFFHYFEVDILFFLLGLSSLLLTGFLLFLF